MSYMTMDLSKLQENYRTLSTEFERRGVSWAIVTKILCGNREYLKAVLSLGASQVCDSRVLNLKAIKKIDPSVETVFIKPPAKKTVPNVIRCADISLNTQVSTIKLLSDEAVQQGKNHRVIIMVELGERREGVPLGALPAFFNAVRALPNIEIIGIGTNLSCLFGVLPNREKLLRLVSARDRLAEEFGVRIPFVSGGTSVTIPLMLSGALPAGINHFRVGDSLFLGSDVYNNSHLPGMHTDVFLLYAQIIEVNLKSPVPDGDMAKNLEGKEFQFDDSLRHEPTCRAIVDAGILELEAAHATPVLNGISIAGVTSDMCVLDLGNNPGDLKVGDYIAFSLDYMGVLRALSSKYVEKRIVNAEQ
ncbi:alanine racemase [Treponema zuelzerae]|uniref:Alanine racemase n=1 Tax=Teretinema zuelzerae TaxID=156 RepID=A0AAE3EHA5_9SPIR|nr:alanine racemase [Teretinema zuelzerae]MCD1653751.1 alanine racemase [Teretinema zuelzerae]